MTVNTPKDLLVFLSVFICAVCIGAVFDIFRALRKVHPPGRGLISFQDAIFCAIAFFMFSHTVSTYADGDLRWYVFAGLVFGLVLYFLTVGKYVLLFFVKFFMIIYKAFSGVSGFFKKLFSSAERPFICILQKVKQFFSSQKGKIKIKLCKKTIKKDVSKNFLKKSLQALKNRL